MVTTHADYTTTPQNVPLLPSELDAMHLLNATILPQEALFLEQLIVALLAKLWTAAQKMEHIQTDRVALRNAPVSIMGNIRTQTKSEPTLHNQDFLQQLVAATYSLTTRILLAFQLKEILQAMLSKMPMKT